MRRFFKEVIIKKAVFHRRESSRASRHGGVSGALKINWEYYIVFNSGILVAGHLWISWILLDSENLVLSKMVHTISIILK